ncbi:agarase [Naegleria gruberi]|uniref:Agarase n=1 Tax=Naegleria gruberi TaxID=5762 RepID=D2VAY6_NAEGR|nr:agarase [Naegleria gruberi]EFC46162.1 agarase [Naegleria gruberi]|eukprot:XP_002678906.1 agarase [Naegleria gruberi]
MNKLCGQLLMLLLLLIFTIHTTTTTTTITATTVTDNFSSAAYINGAFGAPNWLASSYGSFISEGKFWIDNGYGSLTVQHVAASLANDTTFSTNVRILSRISQVTNTVWLTGGVAIYKDSSNYWATHLVESPLQSGSSHFVELGEMKNGVWLSSSQDAISLPSSGSSYNWQYGVDYTATISMSIGGYHPSNNISCIAKVQAKWAFASNGSVVSSLGWCITNPQAVLTGRGAFHTGFLNVVYSNVTSSWTVPVNMTITRQFPAWNPSLSCTSMCPRKATGFFRVEQDITTGKWWFIDPVGNPFYFVAVDHVNYYEFATEALGAQRLLSWGFNTLGTDVSTYLRYKGLAHTITHTTNEFSGKISDITPKTTWTGFPNVFHPQWTDFLYFTFSDYLQYRDDPWVIGHFVDNEIQWWGDSGCSSKDYCLFNQAWLKESNHTAKIAWANLIIDTFGLVNLETEFMNGWGISGINSFATLVNNTSPAIPMSEKAISVSRQFVRNVAEIYFSTVSQALKKVDPNHVYLCNRFPGQAPDIVDIAAKYCDVITYNWYPSIEVNLGIPKQVQQTPQQWVGNYNRPLIITEWSFPALDAGLPSTHGAGMRVDNQAQRAKCYSYFNTFLQSHPLIVGNSYFMYVDEPALGISTTFPENSNYGLLNVNDDPYPLMVQAAISMNFNVCARHSAGLNSTIYQTQPLSSPTGNVTAQNLAGSIPDGLAYDFGSVKIDGSIVRLSWKGSRLATLRITTGTMLSSESSTSWNAPDTTSSVLKASISETSAAVLIQQRISSRGLVVMLQVNVVSYAPGIPLVVVKILSIQNLRTDGQSILVQSITTNGEAHIGDSSWNSAKTQSLITSPSVPGHWLHSKGLYNGTSMNGFGTAFFSEQSSTWVQSANSVTVIWTPLNVNITYNSTFVPSSPVLQVVFPFTIPNDQDPYTFFVNTFTAVQTSFSIPTVAIPSLPPLDTCKQPTAPSAQISMIPTSSTIQPKSSIVTSDANKLSILRVSTILMILVLFVWF